MSNSWELMPIDTERNFWRMFPELKEFEPFKSFRLQDKTKEHTVSSKEMWAVSLIYNFESSILRNYNEADRIKMVEKDFLEKEGFFSKHAAKFEPIIEGYKGLLDNSAFRNLHAWNEDMDAVSKQTSILIQAGGAINIQAGVKIRASMTKMYSEYDRIRDRLRNEMQSKNTTNVNRGATQLSMLEEELEEQDE